MERTAWRLAPSLSAPRHLATFIRCLDNPMTSLPPPVISDSWQGYYHILHYEGDRAVDAH